jgi:hypothetical protein
MGITVSAMQVKQSFDGLLDRPIDQDELMQGVGV